MQAAPSAAPDAAVAALNRLFVQALLRIGEGGDADAIDAACRLAAQGWSLLRHDWPREAERLNGLMHGLTGPRRTAERQPPHKPPATHPAAMPRKEER
jgi:hypothetical protein